MEHRDEMSIRIELTKELETLLNIVSLENREELKKALKPHCTRTKYLKAKIVVANSDESLRSRTIQGNLSVQDTADALGTCMRHHRGWTKIERLRRELMRYYQKKTYIGVIFEDVTVADHPEPVVGILSIRGDLPSTSRDPVGAASQKTSLMRVTSESAYSEPEFKHDPARHTFNENDLITLQLWEGKKLTKPE